MAVYKAPRSSPRQIYTFISAFAVFLVILYYVLANGIHSTHAQNRSQSKVVAERYPQKIWQTSKLGPMDLEERDRINFKRWETTNPGWRHELLSDSGCDEYVHDRFAHRQDIIEAFTELKDNILRADLIRYLVLLGDGGVYSDIDTEALKPVNDWIPREYQNNANVVLGIEYDTFGQGHGPALLDLQLVNWTLMSKGGHALLDLTVRKAIEALRALAVKQNVPLGEIKAGFNDVLASTGPAMLTRATFEYLSLSTGTEITWRNMTGIVVPKLIHDVLILPVTSFANGQTHSNSGSPSDPSALVHHLFSGSWKTGSHAFKAMQEDKQKDAREPGNLEQRSSEFIRQQHLDFHHKQSVR